MLKELMKFASVTLLAGATVLGVALPNAAQALPVNQISQVIFFGDSLTDSGFNNEFPGRLPSKAATFTTLGGYTWSQWIAHDFKGFPLPVYPSGQVDLITNNTTPTNGPGYVLPDLTGIDYACGGSTTNSPVGNGVTYAPSLAQQVNHYIATKPVDPNALYFIWSGANDILKLLTDPTHPPSELQLLITANTAAINISNEIVKLNARGARRFVVLSLPNIGYTPAILSLNSPTLEAEMKTVTFTFNSMLNQQLGEVIKRTQVKVLYFDTYDLLDNVIAATMAGQAYTVAGQTFKFTNFNGAACGMIGSSFVPAILCQSTGTGFIFADDLHPTGTAHRLLSLAVEEAILGWRG